MLARIFNRQTPVNSKITKTLKGKLISEILIVKLKTKEDSKRRFSRCLRLKV